MKTPQLFKSILTCLVSWLFTGTINAQCPTGLFPDNATSNGTDIQFSAVPQPTTFPSGAPHTTYWSAGGPNGNFTGTTNQASPNFGHSFTFANIPVGTYTVCAYYYSGQAGCSTPYSNCSVVTVSAGTPTCATTYSYSTDSNCVTNLVNLSSGNITSSVWTITAWPSPAATYTNTNLSVNSSNFVAVLTNYTNGNLCGQATQTIHINCPSTTSCQAIFSSTSTALCNEKSFSNTSYGNVAYYHWDFGDGTTSDVTNNSTFTHQFPNSSAGYVVSLSVYSSTTSPTACSSYTQLVNVSCPSPTCQASFSVVNTPTCSVKYFQNNTVGSYPKYVWQYGDASGATFSSNTSANHSYPNVTATYIATLSVYTSTTSSTPCSTYTQMVAVSCGTAATCQAAFSANQSTVNCAVNFSNLSPNSLGTMYRWVFGDGTLSAYTASITGISHTYANSGGYVVYLNLYNSSSTVTPYCSTSQTITVSCTTTPSCQVTSSLTIFADTANVGNYFCYNQSTGNGSLSYLWDFGDGTTSTQQYPFHQYAVPGNYVVCLSTTNMSGTVSCSSSYCDSSSVHRMAAGFLMSSINVVPQSVTGIKNISATVSLKAYPNPVGDLLTVEVVSANTAKYTVLLVDAIGREIIKQDLQSNTAIINTSSLEKGYYSLILTNEKGTVVKTNRLIK